MVLGGRVPVTPAVGVPVVVAVGLSVPELSSAVVTALAEVFDTAIGAVVGSAIFNLLVIPRVVATDDPGASRTLVYEEFYATHTSYRSNLSGSSGLNIDRLGDVAR